MNQELQDYIEKTRETGMSDEQIKQELLKVGWKEEDINQEFNNVSVSAPNLTVNPAQKNQDKNIIYYYLAVLKKYATFKGRARRKEYWSFFLVNFLISLLLVAVSFFIRDKGIIGMIYSLLMLIPGIAVAARRLHDINRSGWWLFIGLIPVVGTIIVLIFMFRDGDASANQYGSNPKIISEQEKISGDIGPEKNNKSKILIIIIASVIIIAGILGYFLLIKPSEPKTVNRMPDGSSINAYGPDLSGFANAAKNCSPAIANYTVTNLGYIAKYNLKLESIADGCSFSQRTDDITLQENTEERNQAIINELKKEGYTDTEIQEYLLATEKIQSDNLQEIRTNIGMTRICVYSNTGFLAKMLTDWASGDFGSDKSGFADCTATDASGNKIAVATSGVSLWSGISYTNDKSGLKFNVSIITETQANMTVTDIKTNNKQAVSLELKSPITLFGHTLMISTIQKLGERYIATIGID